MLYNIRPARHKRLSHLLLSESDSIVFQSYINFLSSHLQSDQ